LALGTCDPERHVSSWHDAEGFLQRGKSGRNPGYFGPRFGIEEVGRERQDLTRFRSLFD
jgi:hypothetical protein